MTGAEEVEAILSETVAGLAKLQPEELEELERRARRLAASFEADALKNMPGIRSKADLLERCLRSTEENLRVLRVLRARTVAV